MAGDAAAFNKARRTPGGGNVTVSVDEYSGAIVESSPTIDAMRVTVPESINGNRETFMMSPDRVADIILTGRSGTATQRSRYSSNERTAARAAYEQGWNEGRPFDLQSRTRYTSTDDTGFSGSV
jgi:hypothetical protein